MLRVVQCSPCQLDGGCAFSHPRHPRHGQDTAGCLSPKTLQIACPGVSCLPFVLLMVLLCCLLLSNDQGYVPTLMEDVPDMAVKFAVYETMRITHASLYDNRQPSTLEDLVMGGAAGAAAAAATTPLDVIKTRMMVSASSRPTLVSATQSVLAEGGGMKAFFRGVGPRALSNGINSAVFFCFFEAIRRVSWFCQHLPADAVQCARACLPVCPFECITVLGMQEAQMPFALQQHVRTPVMLPPLLLCVRRSGAMVNAIHALRTCGDTTQQPGAIRLPYMPSTCPAAGPEAFSASIAMSLIAHTVCALVCRC